MQRSVTRQLCSGRASAGTDELSVVIAATQYACTLQNDPTLRCFDDISCDDDVDDSDDDGSLGDLLPSATVCLLLVAANDDEAGGEASDAAECRKSNTSDDSPTPPPTTTGSDSVRNRPSSPLMLSSSSDCNCEFAAPLLPPRPLSPPTTPSSAPATEAPSMLRPLVVRDRARARAKVDAMCSYSSFVTSPRSIFWRTTSSTFIIIDEDDNFASDRSLCTTLARHYTARRRSNRVDLSCNISASNIDVCGCVVVFYCVKVMMQQQYQSQPTSQPASQLDQTCVGLLVGWLVGTVALLVGSFIVSNRQLNESPSRIRHSHDPFYR